MGRRKRRTSAVLSSGSPKSPRVRQGSSVAMEDGPHNGAASTQAQHPPPPQPPRTPQREDRSISPAAGQDLRRASPYPSGYPNPNRDPVQHQPATVPGPVATAATSGPLRPEVGATSRPPPPPPSSPAVGQDLRRDQPAAVTGPVATATTSGALRPEVGATSRPPPLPPSSPSAATTGTPSPSPPSHSSTAVRPVLNKSYASALKGEGPANQDPYADSSRRLYIYLEKFAITSEATACHNHKGPIITLNKTGRSDIKIVQLHLQDYDSELAHDVFSSQDRFEDWLYATVSRFLTSKGIVKNAVAVAGMNAALYTITPSHKTLEDFVKEQGPLVSTESIFGGILKLCVASGIGMRLAHGFLVYILNIHKQGRTWNGKFSTSDMKVVGNCLTCWINQKSWPGKSHCRAADLHKIAVIFKEMFTSNEGMALYFDVLQKDLCGASNVEVEAEWFREYLLSHVALKSSIDRFYLECGLDQARDTIKSNGDLIPSVLLEGSDWMSIIPCKITEDTPHTECSLFHAYYFNYDPTKGILPYAPTIGGLLRYIRNLLQHEQHHINVQDHTEIEQFAAKTFPLALPYILRGLLSRNKMNGPFKVHWEKYHSSRVGNDGNTEGGIGIHISFSEDGSGGGQV